MNKWSQFYAVLKRVLVSVKTRVGRVSKLVLGDFKLNWSAPAWLPRTSEKSLAFAKRYPKPILGTLVALAIIGGATWAGMNYYETHIKPFEVAVIITPPEPPSLIDLTPPSPILVTFSKSVENLKQAKVIDPKFISLSPKMNGIWSWRSDREIQFQPEKEWPVGEEFTVKIKDEILEQNVHLATHSPHFETAPFTAKIDLHEFYQNPENRKQKQIIVHVSFSHPVDTESFKKNIELHYEKSGKGIPFNVTFDQSKRTGFVVSENISMPEKDAEALVEIDDSVRALAGGNPIKKALKAPIRVPGSKTFFKVTSSDINLVPNEKLDTDQVLSIALTDEIGEADFKKNFKVSLLPPHLDEKGKSVVIHSAAQIKPEDLSKITPVELEMVPNEKDHAALFNFKINQVPGATLLVTVNKGIKSLGDYETPTEYKQVVTVPHYPAMLKIQQDGGILSMSGEKKLGIVTRGITKYRISIAHIISSEVANLISQTQGKFTDPRFVVNYRFNFDNVSENFDEDHEVVLKDVHEQGKMQYTSIDLGKYLNRGKADEKGLFYVRLAELNKNDRPLGNSDSRLILVTDLGMIVKLNKDQSRDIFVQSIKQGGPVAGTRIEVLGKNGVPVISTTVNAEGRANLPPLTDFKREKEPIAFVAKHGNDFAFIPADIRDRNLNLSRFDIGGIENAAENDALTAYLFSERGIYRPGDEMNIGFIVKAQNWSKNLDQVPVEAVLLDSRGLKVYRSRFNLNTEGFGSFHYQTEYTAPTGIYQANLYLIQTDNEAENHEKRTLLGSASVKVESFVPDTMKIQTHLSLERVDGWVNPKDLKGQVTLRNLYGTAAIDHKISAGFQLTPAFPKTNAFKDYEFFDPKLSEKSYNETLEDKKTNEQGFADFDLNLDRFQSGMYRLSFNAEGFSLEGGRSVASRSSIIVSPMPYILGYKSNAKLGYLKKDAQAKISILALNSELKPLATAELKMVVQEIKTLSVLSRDADGVYRYQSVKKNTVISETPLNLTAKGFSLDVNTSQAGEFQILVKNPEQKDVLKIEYSVIGQTNVLKKLDKNSELEIKLGKSDYDAGEEIELQVTAPYTGSGLITIEREKVFASKWFKATSTSSVQHIRLPASLEGNAYVHVAFVRDLNSKEIFTSPLSYGVMPFSISKKKREIEVTLEAPEKVKPGEVLNIAYKTSKKSKIVIYGVDEGILQVASYKTPDPLSFFFRKRSLEVQTSQLLDLILPEFSVLKALSASGGDADSGIGRNLNPFKRKSDKPVVFWSEIIDSGPEQKNFRYTVPDYFNGRIHIFAVAVNSQAVGVTDDHTEVRGDFILSPTAPLFTTPNDIFDVDVSVANNLEGSSAQANLEVELKTSAQFQAQGAAIQKVQVAPGHEGVVHFKVKTLDQVGSGNLEFVAKGAQKLVHYHTELSIRPNSYYATTLSAGSLKDDSKTLELKRVMYPQFAKKSFSGGPVPLSLSQGLVQYLTTYPYGCTEQIISKAFPILVLKDNKDFGKPSEANLKNLNALVSNLRSRQSADGGFITWPGDREVNDFYTAYAYHFMLEAQDRGFTIPNEIKTATASYLQNVALERPIKSLSDARLHAYDLYLLARSGKVLSNEMTIVRTALDAKDKAWKKDVAALFLAATYHLYQQEKEADSLIEKVRLGDEQVTDFDHYTDQFYRDSVYLDIVSRYFKKLLPEIREDMLLDYVKIIQKGSYNTISSSMAVLGLDAYASADLRAGAPLEVSQLLEGQKDFEPLTLKGEMLKSQELAFKANKIEIKSKSPLLQFYQASESGFDRSVPEGSEKKGIEVIQIFTDTSGKEIKLAKLGETYESHLKFRALKQAQSNVAIVGLLPSGFEVMLDRSRPASPDDVAPSENGRAHGGDGDDMPANENLEGEDGASILWKLLSPTSAFADRLVGEAEGNWKPDYLDIRDDRVILYGSVTTDLQDFAFRVKAVNSGVFHVPPTYIESMYDRSVHGHSEASEIKVEAQK